MTKILLPLEDTERSLKALHFVKKNFSPEEAEIVLLMIDERLGFSSRSETEETSIKELEEQLDVIAASLDDYNVTRKATVGKAGVRITRTARETGADFVVMTKSSKGDMLSSIGTTAEYVINNSPCDVIIVSEVVNTRNEYRGLVYKTAKGTVNLRGQLGDKQSECLLPSVNQDCIYHIAVTVGKVRFFHTAYNPDTRNWDLPPLPGQEITLDVAAGETKGILVKADSTDGKADRIRIVNRDMRKEAVFSFRITAASENEERVRIERSAPIPKHATSTQTSRDTIEMNRVTEEEPMIPEDFEEPEVPTFRNEPEMDDSDYGNKSIVKALAEEVAAVSAEQQESAAVQAMKEEIASENARDYYVEEPKKSMFGRLLRSLTTEIAEDEDEYEGSIYEDTVYDEEPDDFQDDEVDDFNDFEDLEGFEAIEALDPVMEEIKEEVKEEFGDDEDYSI